MDLAAIDIAIVVLYFGVVIGVGFWFARKAANSLNDYFLGGKNIHWLALAMSGSVSNFDITGTIGCGVFCWGRFSLLTWENGYAVPM